MRMILAGWVMGLAGVAAGQAPTAAVPAAVTPVPGVTYRSGASLDKLAAELMARSRTASSGNVSGTLDKFPAYFTMLATRAKSGGAELHKKNADIFVAMDGECTVITGGTIVDQTGTGDEIRGTRVEGGVSQVFKKGDVMTIAQGVPHQMILEPGKTLTYFVVKVVAEK